MLVISPLSLVRCPWSIVCQGGARDWPVDRPRDWVEWVNEREDPKELMALRCSRDRGQPYGEASWVGTTARRLGVESSLRPVQISIKRGSGNVVTPMGSNTR